MVWHYLILPISSPTCSWGFHAVKQHSQHRPLIERQWGFPHWKKVLEEKKKKNHHTVFLIMVCILQVKEGKKSFMPRAFPQIFTSPLSSLTLHSSRAHSGCLQVFWGFYSSFCSPAGLDVPSLSIPNWFLLSSAILLVNRHFWRKLFLTLLYFRFSLWTKKIIIIIKKNPKNSP